MTSRILGDSYEVQEEVEIHKSEIADQDIRLHDANRLVIITCIINPDTETWDENDIIVATRAS